MIFIFISNEKIKFCFINITLRSLLSKFRISVPRISCLINADLYSAKFKLSSQRLTSSGPHSSIGMPCRARSSSLSSLCFILDFLYR